MVRESGESRETWADEFDRVKKGKEREASLFRRKRGQRERERERERGGVGGRRQFRSN